MTIAVHHGDSRDVLATLAPGSIAACVTDPPYALTSISRPRPDLAGKGNHFARRQAQMPERGFMGKEWDTGETAFDPAFWRLVLRALKPGGHLLAFGGTRTYHRLVCAIEDAGFEIRDQLAWLYGSGFPKSHDVSKALDKAETGIVRGAAGASTRAGQSFGQEYERTDKGEPITAAARQWDGWGTALKPALEPICLARKPLTGTVAGNVLKYGTGALNIDKCRIQAGQRPESKWDSERSLCDSCAARAARTERPSTPETGAYTATRNAALPLSGRAGNVPADTDKTDTGCSGGTTAATTDTSLNTVASGRSGSARSRRDTTFTTSTATVPTTGSKTCAVCRVEITPQNTQSTRQPQNGEPLTPPEPDSAEPQGRWPANCIHDGSAEATAGFPDSASGIAVTRNGGGRKIWSSPNTSGPVPDSGFGDSGSASRYFYSASPAEDELLFWRAKAIIARWNPELANTADGSTSLSKEAGASALSRAVTEASGGCLKSCPALSTHVTPSELRRTSEAVTMAILLTGCAPWRGPPLTRRFQNGVHASVVAPSDPTAIMTITLSHWKSDGSAESAIFAITATSAEAGEAAFANAARYHYSAKADAGDRLGSKHPTVKPVDLMAYLCRLVTPPGGIVLDPFAGSGTTGMACLREGFDCVLIEREAEYVADIRRRIAHVSGQDAPLFAASPQPDTPPGRDGASTACSRTKNRADRIEAVKT